VHLAIELKAAGSTSHTQTKARKTLSITTAPKLGAALTMLAANTVTLQCNAMQCTALGLVWFAGLVGCLVVVASFTLE
jgi:hypothetical protein